MHQMGPHQKCITGGVRCLFFIVHTSGSSLGSGEVLSSLRPPPRRPLAGPRTATSPLPPPAPAPAADDADIVLASSTARNYRTAGPGERVERKEVKTCEEREGLNGTPTKGDGTLVSERTKVCTGARQRMCARAWVPRKTIVARRGSHTGRSVTIPPHTAPHAGHTGLPAAQGTAGAVGRRGLQRQRQHRVHMAPTVLHEAKQHHKPA